MEFENITETTSKAIPVIKPPPELYKRKRTLHLLDCMYIFSWSPIKILSNILQDSLSLKSVILDKPSNCY